VANCNLLPNNKNAQQFSTRIRVLTSAPQLVTCWPQHELFYQMELHYIECINRMRKVRLGVPKVVNMKCMQCVTIWVQNTNTYRECVLTIICVLFFCNTFYSNKYLVCYAPNMQKSRYETYISH
jgi:hypothetical protein